MKVESKFLTIFFGTYASRQRTRSLYLDETEGSKRYPDTGLRPTRLYSQEEKLFQLHLRRKNVGYMFKTSGIRVGGIEGNNHGAVGGIFLFSVAIPQRSTSFSKCNVVSLSLSSKNLFSFVRDPRGDSVWCGDRYISENRSLRAHSGEGCGYLDIGTFHVLDIIF